MFPWAVSSRSLSKTIWLVKLVVYVTGPDPVEVGGFMVCLIYGYIVLQPACPCVYLKLFPFCSHC
jgi:hypothetical protein